MVRALLKNQPDHPDLNERVRDINEKLFDIIVRLPLKREIEEETVPEKPLDGQGNEQERPSGF